jgi:AraC family transcriptional regulator of adaptative response / DNA-3-methyladenine glycosylase II
VTIGRHTGWLAVRDEPERHRLVVELSESLVPILPAVLGRVRQLFDLNARPDLIAAHLSASERLADLVAGTPGLRVPGAFDGFELAVRAILGQQVTVKAATTIAGRFVAAFGAPLETPHAGLVRSTPTAARVARASADDVASLGIIRTRAESIIALARAVAEGELLLEPGADAEATMARLVALPGIGSWTAHYIAMRALRWADAFPKEDVVLRKRLGGISPAAADGLSLAWRPWRSYATLHLWRDEARADGDD